MLSSKKSGINFMKEAFFFMHICVHHLLICFRDWEVRLLLCSYHITDANQ